MHWYAIVKTGLIGFSPFGILNWLSIWKKRLNVVLFNATNRLFTGFESIPRTDL